MSDRPEYPTLPTGDRPEEHQPGAVPADDQPATAEHSAAPAYQQPAPVEPASFEQPAPVEPASFEQPASSPAAPEDRSTGSYPAYGTGAYGSGSYGGYDPGPASGGYGSAGYAAPGYATPQWGSGHAAADTAAFGPTVGPTVGPAYGRYVPPAAGAPAPPNVPAVPPSAGAPKPERPRRTVLVAAAVAAVVGAGVGAGTVAVVEHDNRPSAAGLQYSTEAAPAAKVDGTVTAAADKIRPSVVTIEVTSNSERDTGSGVVIRSDGYILTNNHVVSGSGSGASTVVTLADGRRAAATVVGRDPSDDLAVIKVPLTGLRAATFASSASLVVGQTVVAVGAPLGLSDTVTAGIVSSTARPVQTGDSTSTATFNAVQTDAAINPGNSGGPLVNLNGDVVGINAAIATDQSQGGLQVPGQTSQSGNIGIGFAIPSDEARRIAGELITTGKATHAVMGVSVRDASQGGSASEPVGARVQTVTAGGPAADAGIKVGDVITQVDTQRIDGADAVVAAIRSRAPFQSVKITYVRGGSTTTVTVRLESATD